MNKKKKGNKISGLLEPKMQSCFICLLVFAGITFFLNRYLAAGELVVVVLLYIVYLISRGRRKKEIERYIASASSSMDTASKRTMLSAPMPMVVFRPESDEIVWSNDLFLKLCGKEDQTFDLRMSDAVPQFDYQWLMEGKKLCPTEIQLGGSVYQVYGTMSHVEQKDSDYLLMATTYWMDVTAYSELKREHAEKRPVGAVIALDNYEDLLKGITEKAKNTILAEIDDRMQEWTRPTGGYLCKYDRDRYLFLCDEKGLKVLQDGKFSIQESVRQVISPNSMAATLSIGIGRSAGSYEELLQFANLALEMALSRGGDQTVLRNPSSFEFHGGRNVETERRTKVKSRVMSSALAELLTAASHVFVMGHRNPDLDALGAAVGVCTIARKKGVPCYIIDEKDVTPCDPLKKRLKETNFYKKAFISAQDAMVMADNRSLLVVVDTNRPEQVQARELLESFTKVAVIDHHRRASTYINDAAMNFHEPYASSACELVAELMGYLLEAKDVTKLEAEAVLSGIMLDTKNFTMRTGGRTFEAAAYLRRLGADTIETRRLLQQDLSHTVARFSVLQTAKMYRGNIAIAEAGESQTQVIAAQAADELLNVSGVEASFVLFPKETVVSISGRSISGINVQVILEKLGGGGNAQVAGAQLADCTLETALERLHKAIDEYFTEG